MSQHASPPRVAIRRLPLGATVWEAYGRVFGHVGLVFRAAVLPFTLSVLIGGIALAAYPYRLLTIALVLVGLVPFTLFGVSWHRLTLLGPQVATPPLFPGWRRRHWRFLGYLAAVSLIVYGLLLLIALAVAVVVPLGAGGLPSGAGQIALVTVIVLAAAYVMVRLGFVFPAIAVDETYGLRHAWVHTHGQGLRILGAVLLAVLPMVALLLAKMALIDVVLIDSLVLAPQQDTATAEDLAAHATANAVPLLASQVINAVLNYIALALALSTISIAFRVCTGWVPALGGAQPPE